MERKVTAFIEQNKMLSMRDKIIVGVSGGADSICLLLLLIKLRKKYNLVLHVVHVDHSLRGEESDDDARFVEHFCEENNISCRIFKYDVAGLASKEGRSIEEMGRILRYHAFEEQKKYYRATKIATAHHMDDNAETMLLNLFRGTGLRGLSGIAPVRDDVIRPLMCVSRLEIEEYLKECGIEFRTDSTNLCDDYTRNKIRHNILGYAEKNIFDNITKHMFETSKQLRMVDKYMINQAEIELERIVIFMRGIVKIDNDEFARTDPALRNYVVSLVWKKLAKSSAALSRGNVESICSLLCQPAGKRISLPDGYTASTIFNGIVIYEKDRIPSVGYDIVEVIPPNTVKFGPYDTEYSFSLEEYNGERKKISRATYTKCFDYDKIMCPLVLRTRKPGDSIVIDSSGSTQSLNRYFINQKVPSEIRDTIPVLASGSNIIWIIGGRIGEAVKITDETKNMLIVSKANGKNTEEEDFLYE